MNYYHVLIKQEKNENNKSATLESLISCAIFPWPIQSHGWNLSQSIKYKIKTIHKGQFGGYGRRPRDTEPIIFI